MNASRQLVVYDTTLRDGLQRYGVTCSLEDKIKIARKLARFGVPFIEGGWPGSNPTDTRFFEHFQREPLKQSQLVAFCSTRRANRCVSEDDGLKAVIDAQTTWIATFGKSWDLHVQEALKVSLQENLAMIRDTVQFFREHQRHVIYDAEHWFDGYKANPDYALQTLDAAITAGAEWIVLCDTNGGTLPKEIEVILIEVQARLKAYSIDFPQLRLGIHAHNDSGTAVASTLAAVDAGVDMLQGTINGYGERCGNADLCTLIPNLQLKMGYGWNSPMQLETLMETSHFVSETLNLPPRDYDPYVGASAFAHKGGIHISAVKRNPKTYEHVVPSHIGNNRHVVISSSSGISTILAKANCYGISLDRTDPVTGKILKRLKELESQGYQFEAAEASFELLMLKELGIHKPLFQLKSYRVHYEEPCEDKSTQAIVKVSVGGEDVLESAEEDGPVSALDQALRKAIRGSYAIVDQFYLTDYKVRILNSEIGTGANIRVLVESSNSKERWSTIGVSVNIIEASYQAVVAGIEYGLYRFSSISE